MYKELAKTWTEDSKDYDDIIKKQLLDKKSVDYWMRELEEICGKEKLNILDVGCGPGFLTIMLNRLGHNVKPIDAAIGMVEKANANFKAEGIDVTAKVEDAVLLPEEEINSYDLIISRDVVWTLYDPEEAFQRWNDVLKDNGKIVYYDSIFRDYKKSLRLGIWHKISVGLIWLTEHKVYRQDIDRPVGAFANLPFFSGDRPELDKKAIQNAGFKRMNFTKDRFRNSLRRMERWKYGYSGVSFRIIAYKN
ncbi:Methyltransferase domain-containing protein [Acetitomaculum ruminis DSM 5522]|uniref:Methyltransferase domain-containing protein n=1 Tax=Acetitomaculum ruminis DSM 5522 TaxID=1120918 RepID=A0A1I0WP19_9FIRM|nr:class I SAM-dependent methyltransferase [Acetitomaculum ruminis]SFA89910.1 Methyltransferase domain-containing protein [Acetitomaculum ruminis DSM 5522]